MTARSSDRSRGQPSDEDVQLLRGAVAFAIGALDAYMHDLVLEVLPAFTPQSEDLDRMLGEINTRALVVRMAQVADLDTARGELRGAVDKHLDDKSFMGPQGVMRAIRLVACRMDWKKINAEIGGADAAADLGRYRDIRHKIVHRGLNPRPTRNAAKDCNDIAASLGALTDGRVIQKHFR